jgi:hypothetical protein
MSAGVVMSPVASDRGIALIGVVIAVSMLMALAATMAITVNMDTQLRGAFGHSMTGFYAAESGLNKGMGEFKNLFLDFHVPTSSDFAPRSFDLGTRTVEYALSERAGNPRSVTIPLGELFGGLNSIQYTYTVTSKARNVIDEIEASVGAEFLVGNIPIFQFVAFYDTDLEILPGANMTLRGRVHTNGDLYLNTEDSRTFSIEDNPATGITTVQVSAKGDIYRGRKNISECRGTVVVDKLEDVVAPTPNLDPRTLTCSGGTRKVPVSELALWKGSIVSQIESISVPRPDIIQVGTGVFWQRADLRIALVIDPDGNPNTIDEIEVQDATGARDPVLTQVLRNMMTDENFNATQSTMRGTQPLFYTDLPLTGTAGDGTVCNCTNTNPSCGQHGNRNCYVPAFSTNNRVYSSNMTNNNQQPTAGVFDDSYRRGGFYNWREKKWMKLLNVNVADLLRWNQLNGNVFFAPNDASDGGIVLFLTVSGPNSNAINNYGVRVFGSANLPIPGGIGVSADPTGITVVSDQAIYVMGDYNRAAGGGDLPKQPAALIGDSVNLLSNNYWQINCTANCRNDAQSVLSLGDAGRAATTTRVNSAFLGGVDQTGPGQFNGNYNGGLENYPRFHESWSNQTLNYAGSFVSLGTPLHVNGAWCGTGGSLASGCNIYNPPTRAFDYDPVFNSAANLPPLTPRFVYVQQVLFTEDFK